MVATLQRDPQVTHCRNCPLNCNNTCTAPRSGYPIHPNMPAGADCHRDIEVLGQQDEQGKAQAELNTHIDAQANAIAPEPPRFTDNLTPTEKRKAAAFLSERGRDVDPGDVLEFRLCPQYVKWGQGSFWIVVRNAAAPPSPDIIPVKIVELEAFRVSVQEPVAELPARMSVTDMGKMAYLQKLQATLPPHKQNRVAAIFTIDDKPRMRAVTICYQANYLLADGRKAVMFYEHGKEPTDAIRTMANVPV